MACSRGCCPDFKTHIKGIHLSVGAAASQVQADNAGDKQIVRDHAAYKRMKQEGLQPKSVRGVAQVEAHATDAREIQEGKIIPKETLVQRDIVRSAMGEAGML